MSARGIRGGTPWPAALGAGIALWALGSLLTSRREPWDAGSYWLLIYPAAIVYSGWLGRRYPAHAVGGAMVLFQAQFLAQMLRAREVGNLWPLGMLLFAVISLPGALVARWQARRVMHEADA